MADWQDYELKQLEECKNHGLSVKQTARVLHRRTEDVGEKLNEMDFSECDCCKQSIVSSALQTYTMADDTEQRLCHRCALVVDWTNDF